MPDKPEEEFDCEYGCQPMDHGIGIYEQQETALLYIQENYTAPAREYGKMVRRETDGPDPLVQEPKGRP